MAIVKGQLAFNVKLQSVQDGVKRWIQCVYAKLQPSRMQTKKREEEEDG